MEFIKKIYASLKSSDYRLLAFAFVMMFLMFSQTYIAEPIEELEVESSLVEELDSETEEKSSSKKMWEYNLFSLNNSSTGLNGLSFDENYVVGNKKFSNAGHVIEILLPPPENFTF